MRLAWLVFLLAFGLRFGHIWEIRDSVLFESPLVDAYVYDQAAREVASHGPRALEIPYYQPPLYPMLLGGAYALSGGSYLAPRLVQALAGAGTVLCAFLLASQVGGRRAGLIAALLLGFYGPVLFFEGELLPPTLVLCLNTWAVFLWIAADRSPRPGVRCAVVGLLLGLSTAIRPTTAILLAGGLIWWLARGGESDLARRRRRMGAAQMLVAFLVPILPFSAANYWGAGEPIALSYNGGINFYLGNGTNADSLIAIQPGHAWDRLQVEPRRAGVSSRREEQDYWIRRTVEEVRADPEASLKSLGRKVIRLFDARETPRNLDYEVWRRDSRLLSLPVVAFGFVAPLAALGIGFPFLDRRLRGILLISLGAVALQNLLFFVAGRYRVEAAPVLCVLAGLGVARVWTKHALRLPWRALTFAAALATFVHVDLLGERAIDEPRAAINRGLALRRMGYLESARSEYLKALRMRPQDPDAHRLLGELQMAEEDYSSASRSFEQALQGAPDYIFAYLGKAQALEHMGEGSRAAAAYRRALESDPFSTDVRLNYGVFLAKNGRPAQARRMFEEGARLNPNDARFSKNLENLERLEAGS